MNFLEFMPAYFAGEKAIGHYAVPIGLVMLCLGFAIWRLHWMNPMARGLFYPMILLGILAIGVGGVMYFKSQADVERLSASYETRAAETVQEELERMAKVNANWIRIKLVWTVLLLVGMGVVLFVKHETWSGVALGLILIGACGFVIDHLAERRAMIYTGRLERLEQGLQEGRGTASP